MDYFLIPLVVMSAPVLIILIVLALTPVSRDQSASVSIRSW